MDAIFPTGLPVSTAFYLSLYLLTFVLHQAFMHYVLAGCLYVAWVTVRPGREAIPASHQLLASTIRDWMPFLLSAAITAGVAPLLFIQIVYQQQFYTANLLLWWRWMLVVPVLIVSFYLLYLIKSSVLWKWPYPIRVLVTCGTACCLVFVGFCWTVNHLLASSGADWPDVYVTGRFPFSTGTILYRMAIWIGGSFATMSMFVGWQLLYRQNWNQRNATPDPVVIAETRSAVRTLANLTALGLVVAFIAAATYLMTRDEGTQRVLFGPMFVTYLWLSVISLIWQWAGWYSQWRSARFRAGGLFLVTVSTVVGLLSVSVVREGLRIRAIDLASLAQWHLAAASVAGFGVFVVCAVAVSLTIVWCVRLVQQGLVGENN